MDVFPDRESARAFANQSHDYNPGITEEGLFWTLLMTPESVSTSSRRAEMCLRDQFIPDMHTFENAVARGPIDPATIAIDCTWSATSGMQRDRDPENQFVYRFREADARVEWQTTGPSGNLRSVMTGDPQETLYGAIGRERNGAFFS